MYKSSDKLGLKNLTFYTLLLALNISRGNSIMYIEPDYKERIKDDFPILSKTINGSRIVYLDSSATSLKPKTVLSKISDFYNNTTSNAYRGTSVLAESVTLALTDVRTKVADFIGANHQEIIFTSNATDAINKLSLMLNLKKEDEVLTTVLEHHSNFLPWLARASVKVVGLDENGDIDIGQLESMITSDTKLVTCSFVSNVMGNIQNVYRIIEICKKHSVLSLIDATQMAGHKPFNVKDMDCDFLVFSAHKMLGPSGVGVLYVHNRNFKNLTPAFYGGGMVDKITQSDIKYKAPPYCFEAGTPNIENLLGLGAAVDYINNVGIENISKYMDEIDEYLVSRMQKHSKIVFPFCINKSRLPICTFGFKNRNIDIGYIARLLSDSYGIILNSGYQCCQPLYNHYKVNGGIRISCYLYNTTQDIDCLINALNELEFML